MNSCDNLMSGTPSGKVVIAGDPDKSVLLRSIRGEGLSRNPPGSAGLTSSEIGMIVTWNSRRGLQSLSRLIDF
jgi:hypothetical protein